MPTFGQDSFTDTDNTLLQNHTPNVGGSWIKHTSYGSGEMVILSNQTRNTPLNGNVAVYYNNGAPAGTDYNVSIDVDPVLQQSGNAMGPCARIDTAADTFYLLTIVIATGWQLYRRTAGSFVQIGSTSNITFTDSVTYTAFLDCAGTTPTTLTTKVNGSGVCGSPQSDPGTPLTAAGKSGIRWSDGGIVDTVGDNFLAADDAGATGKMFLTPLLNGLGAGGPFLRNPLG